MGGRAEGRFSVCSWAWDSDGEARVPGRVRGFASGSFAAASSSRPRLGANLTGGVQLIPANLKWMRLADAVKVGTLGRRVRPSPGTRTVTKMPGQIVWRRHVSTALALKTLRNEAGSATTLGTLRAYSSNGKLGRLDMKGCEVGFEHEAALHNEVFVQVTAGMLQSLADTTAANNTMREDTRKRRREMRASPAPLRLHGPTSRQ